MSLRSNRENEMIRSEWEIIDQLTKKLQYSSFSATRVYLAISSLIKFQDDEIRITYSMLRERTDLDISTIISAVKELVDGGLITKIKGRSLTYSMKQ
jgi:DNA-binding MarR family transcriptional regulator